VNIEVIPASKDQELILANLLELYAHDFSEFHIGDKGGRKVRLSTATTLLE